MSKPFRLDPDDAIIPSQFVTLRPGYWPSNSVRTRSEFCAPLQRHVICHLLYPDFNKESRARGLVYPDLGPQTQSRPLLKRLKGIFNTWSLALAAYNCGEASLKKQTKNQRVRDFHRLNLPLETERYIFRIVAIKIIMEDPERYGYSLPQDRIYRPIKHDTVPVRIRINILHCRDPIGFRCRRNLEVTFTRC